MKAPEFISKSVWPDGLVDYGPCEPSSVHVDEERADPRRTLRGQTRECLEFVLKITRAVMVAKGLPLSELPQGTIVDRDTAIRDYLKAKGEA